MFFFLARKKTSRIKKEDWEKICVVLFGNEGLKNDDGMCEL